MTLAVPPDPGESSATAVPQLTIIETDDIDIFSDIRWIQPGRFSDILYGFCHSLGETVALKRLRASEEDEETSERDLRLFNEEATIWHMLDHPHVLPLRGIYLCPMGFTYLVSPYMDNGDLISYLKHNPLVDRRGLLCDIASAIAYLHSLSIIHGDIKARNILVSADGAVRLCDFGLSKHSSWTTSEGRKGAGTIRWQSPELLFDEPRSFKSDVYAFGITIYEVLSGNIPFGSSSDGAIVYNVVLRNTRPPCLPKCCPRTGISYATTWAVARSCWHRVAGSRPEMREVWKRLEMEVFPDATLKVLKEKAAAAAAKNDERVWVGGAESATGGVGPPPASARRARAFTVDAEDEDEEEDNELSQRRHTIDVDSFSHVNVPPEEEEEEEEEEEFLFTPPDSPLLGATEGSAAAVTARDGLLPSELSAIDEGFSLDGGSTSVDQPDEEEHMIPTVTPLPKLSINLRKGAANSKPPIGGSSGGSQRSMHSADGRCDSCGGSVDITSSRRGRGEPGGNTKSSRRGEGRGDYSPDEDHEDESDSRYSPHGRRTSDAVRGISSGSSDGTLGYLISTFTSVYEYTKSIVRRGGKTTTLDNSSRNQIQETIIAKSSSGGSNDQLPQMTSVDWSSWEGGAPIKT